MRRRPLMQTRDSGRTLSNILRMLVLVQWMLCSAHMGHLSQGPGRKITPTDFAVEQWMTIRPLTRNNLQLSIFFTRQEFEDEIRLMRNQSDVVDQAFILFTDCLDDLVALFQRAPGGIMTLFEGANWCSGKYRRDRLSSALTKHKTELIGIHRVFENIGKVQQISLLKNWRRY